MTATKKSCRIDGCTATYRSGGYCIRHREEAISNGTLRDLRYRENRPPLEVVMCGVEGCEQVATYRGKRLCMKHYLRIWTHGSTELAQPLLSLNALKLGVKFRHRDAGNGEAMYLTRDMGGSVPSTRTDSHTSITSARFQRATR